MNITSLEKMKIGELKIIKTKAKILFSLPCANPNLVDCEILDHNDKKAPLRVWV